MELIVGTYDEVVLGFRVVEIGEDFQIETSFTDHSHAGCVKTLAVSGKGILASGSTDETIRLLNLKKQQELGSLIHHAGTVTSLEFHKGFLFSTSEDGKLCLWKAFTWECLRTFKGHKAAVSSVSVHPSGKLALTVGADRSLRTWNLITGRSAYITNIKQVADIVKWTPSGEKYLLVINNKIDVYSVETAEVTNTIQSEGRINCLDFYDDTVCVYGGEGGSICFHDIETSKVLHKLDTDTNRVKGLCICPSPQKDDSCKKWLCMCSSDGHIKIFKIRQSEDKIDTHLLVEHTSSFRLTCLAVYNKASDSHTEVDEAESVEDEISKRTDKVQKQKAKKRKTEDVIDRSDTAKQVKVLVSERPDKSFEKSNKKGNRLTKGKMDTVENEVTSNSEITKHKKLPKHEEEVKGQKSKSVIKRKKNMKNKEKRNAERKLSSSKKKKQI